MIRQFPDTQTDQSPFILPFNECSFHPGRSICPALVATSSRARMRSTFGSKSAATPRRSPRWYRRARPLCRKLMITGPRPRQSSQSCTLTIVTCQLLGTNSDCTCARLSEGRIAVGVRCSGIQPFRLDSNTIIRCDCPDSESRACQPALRSRISPCARCRTLSVHLTMRIASCGAKFVGILQGVPALPCSLHLNSTDRNPLNPKRLFLLSFSAYRRITAAC